MATTTTCDICPGEPRSADDPEPRAAVAPWNVSVKTLKGSVVENADSKDCCARHVPKAVETALEKAGRTGDFLRIEVNPTA